MNLTDNGLNLNYQPYKYTDYNECNSAHDSDMHNHFTNIFPDTKYYSGHVFNTSRKPLTPGISFIHLNARSLNSNFREIDDYLSSLNYQFDIIAISETWVSEPEHNKFNINGYDVYHTNRKNKRGGGVALYVKQELACKFLSCKSLVVDDLFECCTLEILISGHRNIIVSCIYRCPGSNTDIFSEHIVQLFFELTMRKTVFLCGDFNIDILKHKVNQGTKSFLDTMYSIGLYPLIDRPTRISNHSFTLIDNVFTNVTNHKVTSGILVSDISDHLPIFVFCTYPNPNRADQKCNVKKRIINENSLLSLSNNLAEECWDNVFRSADVDTAYGEFMTTFSKQYNICCPMKTVRNSFTRRDKPWITNGLKNACHKKNRLYKQFLCSRSHTCEEKYKTYKNKLTSILRTAEKEYYSKLLTDAKGNIKSTWKILNTIINKKTNTSKLPSHFECNEINIVSKQSIADGFNNFFVDVGSNLDKKITVADNAASIYDFMGQQCPNSMFINPVSEDEVVNIIKSCKPKHSKDCDDINMYVLSKVTDQIVKPLVHIFNLSFSSGIFPSEMKTAKVIPVFKSGNRSDFSNYRPISLLSQFSKILEKLFNLRLEQFLISNEILSNCQYGFRSSMSTVHAALELIESISTAVDNKKHCAGVFIDLKKAFDTVNHDLLVKKLFFYGIRGTANAWLNNYLTNRNQYVIADDHSSGMRLITCGVPQGSVLGPVLFLLYINDICNVSNLLKFVLFADDTNIFCSSTSLHDLQDTINRELDKLFVWFSVNRLSLNLGKTNYMLFRSRPPDNELALKINNVVLPRVAATKFLGIIIDDKLSWKPHIQSVKSKLSSVLSIMYKASKLINTTGMYTLYCSLFHPYLSYCNEIWGNTYTSNVKCLFTLQKKAIRLICNADRLAHTNAMFKDMSILKLSEFVKYKTAIVMFNIFHGTLPIQLQMRFTKYSSVYSTRQTKSFVMVQVRTNLKAMCLSVHGVKLWNTLPDDIKNCTSVNIFKKCIKKHFLSHY